MKRSNPDVLPVSLAIVLFLVLGMVFVLLPVGWNLIPLLLIAIVAVALSVRLQSHRAAQEGAASERRTIEIDETDLKRMDSDTQEEADMGHRLNRAFGPIVAGMLIDLLDFTTFGPIGLVVGFPIGVLIGYWMGRSLGLSPKASLGCAFAAGIYCTTPATEFIPLATIVGAYMRFNENRNQRYTGNMK